MSLPRHMRSNWISHPSSDIGYAQLDIHTLFALVNEQTAKIAELEHKIVLLESDASAMRLPAKQSEPPAYEPDAGPAARPVPEVAISSTVKHIFTRIATYTYERDGSDIWVGYTISLIQEERKRCNINLIKNGAGQTLLEFTMARIERIKNLDIGARSQAYETNMRTCGALNGICGRLIELGAV